MVFEREDSNAVIVRQGVGLLVYRLIEAYSNRKELSLQNELRELELIIQRGLEDSDQTTNSHFRLCAKLYKEYSQHTLSKPLIEVLSFVYLIKHAIS